MVLLISLLLGATVQLSRPFPAWELAHTDLWHQLAGRRHEPVHTAIVAIDDEALALFPNTPLAFWGPYFANSLATLRSLEVTTTGIDFLFAVSAENWLSSENASPAKPDYDLNLRTQLGAGGVVLAGMVSKKGKDSGVLHLPVPDLLYSLPDQAESVGLINLTPDRDGVVRHLQTHLLKPDAAPPRLSFATLLALRATGNDPKATAWTFAAQRRQAARESGPIRFVGPPGTIPTVSMTSLLAANASQRPEVQSLRGKIVIIAPNFSGMQDFHLTPYASRLPFGGQGMMTGAEIHANIIETLLASQRLRLAPSGLVIAGLLPVLALAATLSYRLPPWSGLLTGVLLSQAWTGSAYLLFRSDWMVPVGPAHASLAAAFLASLGLRLTGEERQRRELRAMFEKYMTPEVLEDMLATGRPPALGGELRQITVLFSDIRNFTTLSSILSPSEVVEMLNHYFQQVCTIIQEEGGIIDKFIGDAVMVLFGAPINRADHAWRAVRTGQRIASFASGTFRHWMAKRFAGRDLTEFSVGVGIHTGPVIIGNIGSQARMEYTAIGDTVNLASRIEGVTKETHCMILASRATTTAAQQTKGGDAPWGEHWQVRVKGKSETIEVVEVHYPPDTAMPLT